MTRHAAGWITNVKHGGRPLAAVPDTRDEGRLPFAPLTRWGRSLPASTSCTAPMGAPPCSRSTACRPGRACRRSRAPASPRIARGRSCRRARGADGARGNGVTGACGEQLPPPSRRLALMSSMRRSLVTSTSSPSGHRMTAAEFVRSAEAAAAPLAMPGARVGTRILGAVEATLRSVGTNTNLGIILLCAPLAVAAEARSADLRAALAQVLESLDIQDAELAFRAIARAAPAGPRTRGAARCRRDRDCHAQSRHGRGIGPRSHRPPICQWFRRCFRAGRACARSSPGARNRAQMGHACGLPRISLGLSGQPYRPQARHRDCRGHMPRRVALSCSECDRPRIRPISSPIFWPGMHCSKSGASIPEQARTSRSRPYLPTGCGPSCRRPATMIDFETRTKSAAIWLTGPAHSSRTLTTRVAVQPDAEDFGIRTEVFLSLGGDGDGKDQRNLRG